MFKVGFVYVVLMNRSRDRCLAALVMASGKGGRFGGTRVLFSLCNMSSNVSGGRRGDFGEVSSATKRVHSGKIIKKFDKKGTRTRAGSSSGKRGQVQRAARVVWLRGNGQSNGEAW